VITARNVIPRTKSYGPFRKLTVISDALTARCLGAVSVRDVSDNVYVYAGDTSKLYEMLNNSFNDESKAGGYSTNTDDSWEFAIWNQNNQIIATNYADPVQALTIGGGASGAFADLFTSATPPKAKHVGIVHRFAVFGFMNDPSDGVVTNRVQWTEIGNAANIAPGAATQSDYEDLATGGVVQRIIGGTEYGLIFQNNAVRTMRYVGAGPVFDLFQINYAPGTPISNGIIAHKGMVFYISEDGFMGINGVNVEPIGTERIDRYFWDQFDITNRRYVSTGIDPVNKIVAWAFPGTGASSNLPNRILMYKYDEGKWSEAEIDTELLLSTETQGYTLDSLDDLGTDIDNAGVFDESFDSDKWRGGSYRFAAFDQAHKLNFFTGPSLAATIETGDLQPDTGKRWQCNGARVLVDGGDARVSVAGRTRLKDTVTYGSSSDMNIDGVCKLRSEGRYQRFRLSLSSSTSWSHVQGLGIQYELKGGR